MSTPASLDQGQKLLSLFKGTSSDQVQNLLANGDLLKSMLTADLTKVDRGAFKALLAPTPMPIAWTPVAEYIDKLRGWNDRFQLGLMDEQIEKLKDVLPIGHAGSHLPTGIKLLLGKGLQYDWKVVMQVLEYELVKIGVPFKEYVDTSYLSYFLGSEPPKTDKPTLDVALLDIGTFNFWGLQNDVMCEVRTQRLCWPGLEVAWLLALNPQVYLAMDGETVPYMLAPGLVHYSKRLPYFSRDSRREAFVHDDGEWDQFHRVSVVAFQEC